jgi:hypothetical protein
MYCMLFFSFHYKTQLQEHIIDILKYWCTNFKADGLYLKHFDRLIYTNKTTINMFINNLRRECRISMQSSYQHPVALVGDYSIDDKLINHLFDLFRVDLNAVDLYNHIRSSSTSMIQTDQLPTSSNPFEIYISESKKIIWSFSKLDHLPHKPQSRRSLLIGFYFLIYSLPGITLIRQGDELEYEQIWPRAFKLFRWNDLLQHSGFSNQTEPIWWLSSNEEASMNSSLFEVKNEFSRKRSSSTQSLLNEYGFDQPMALGDERSLINFIIYFNQRVKPKLMDTYNNRLPILHTTPFPVRPKAPQPFANSYNSISNNYIKEQVYNLTIINALYKVIRQINSAQANKQAEMPASFALRFYRNVMFIINFSDVYFLIENLIQNTSPIEKSYMPGSAQYGNYLSEESGFLSMLKVYNSQIQEHVPIHIIYDSSRELPEYIKFNKQNQQSAYILKPNQYIAIEY